MLCFSPAECYPLIRQIGPAARVGLSKKSLRVAGATILTRAAMSPAQ